jgi:pimeloyl-ACP methyl ester carboxylesterase
MTAVVMSAVFVHGAGHAGSIWDATRRAMAHPSLAVDIPGRRTRPADITTVSIEQAADSIASDIVASVAGDMVLVGHSVGGVLLPAVTARLGPRVRQLVFVAGITAPEGQLPLEVFLPGKATMVADRLAQLRRDHQGQTLEGLDSRTGRDIDSLNLASQPVSWVGVPRTVGRTFVRCLADPLQPRALQDQFIAHCAAEEVLEIDTGHTPAVDAPEDLAVLLDGILSRVPRA